MSIKDIRPQEEIENMMVDITQMRKNSDSTRYSNWRHQKKNGEIIIVETTSHSFHHNERTARIVIVNDITQKTLTEQKLLENQLKLNEAQAIGHISNWDIDLLKNVHIWSDELYEIYGLNKLETEPSIELFLSFIHPEERDIAKSLIDKALHDFSESKIDFRFRTYTGEKRYGHIEWRFDYDINKNPIRLFGILQDITERKKAEESSKRLESQIREQKIQEQKKISKAIIKAQEQQRNHIAQELHDNINQILFDAKVHLDIAGRTNQPVKELIKYPLEQINNSMQEIRLLCQNLAAPLTDIQLQEIINDLIDKYNDNVENPIKIKFSYQIPFEFSDDLKLNIYRIIQEQLHNIHKHAAARNVNIHLFVKRRCIRIIVQDDGKGYNIKLKRRGMGISNIKHRVEAFNGKIKIQSKLGEGCKTEIMIPYES